MSDRLLDLVAEHTEPTPEELDDLRRALASRTADARVARALLRHLPAPTAAEVDGVRHGVRHGVREAPRRRWVLPLALGGAVALAAAAVLVFGVGVGAWLALDRNPAVAIALDPASPAALPVGDAVVVRPSGAGSIGGTERAPRVTWTAGTIEIEVAPGAGVAMTVVTREAEVRVVGTVFEVTRDALGTRVSVDRGLVAVACVAGPTRTLGAGQEATCLPTTAPGLLGRANDLKRAGADPADVLATVELALPSARGPFLGELLALQAEALLALDRPAEARTAADRYLEAGGPRVEDLLQIGASAALADGGCPAALPYLQDLEERGAGSPEQLERCEAGR